MFWGIYFEENKRLGGEGGIRTLGSKIDISLHIRTHDNRINTGLSAAPIPGSKEVQRIFSSKIPVYTLSSRLL
jgi:hypothetical protein